MSNEIKCCLLVYGPESEVANFTQEFARDQFQAHVPIAPDARPKQPCDPVYLSRRLAEEHWGSRFIYARPGVLVHRGDSVAREELCFTEKVVYESRRLPKLGDEVSLITFTVPSDPPALWIAQVINRYYDRGLMFLFRWWDLENYHRCVDCGALDGICLRAGAFWSVPGDDHAACWSGGTRCNCPAQRLAAIPTKLPELRRNGQSESGDDSVVSMRAFADGPGVRIISTHKSGKRTMTRVGTMPEDAEHLVREVRNMNNVLDEQAPVNLSSTGDAQ